MALLLCASATAAITESRTLIRSKLVMDGDAYANREEWHTEGKTVTFFAEENRMLLKGRSSTVYQRVQ